MEKSPEDQTSFSRLMGHPDLDAESLQKRRRRRGDGLLRCVLVSVLLLFAALAAVTAAGVVVLLEVQSVLERSGVATALRAPERLSADAAGPAYKMQNFAYLEATSGELKNSTMTWDPVHYAASQSVGALFSFDRAQHSLQPTQDGMYFIYVDLQFSCTGICRAGVLSVRVGDQLTCEVGLPATTDVPVSRKCWAVKRVSQNTRLLAQMSVPEKGLGHWKLETKISGLGVFLVD